MTFHCFIVGFCLRLLLNKPVFGFLTGSYRIEKDKIIEDWQSKYRNLLGETAEIIRITGLSGCKLTTS